MGTNTSRAPVLMIVFRRPEETGRVLEKVLEYEPPQLYVFADAPRKNNVEEALLCAETLSVFGGLSRYEGRLKIRQPDSNLGCRRSVLSALSWFFANEEKGIILEDDCLPSQDFFSFANSMLSRFEHDRSIGHISGFSSVPPLSDQPQYFKSRYAFIWGWATWRRAFEGFPQFSQELSMARAQSILNAQQLRSQALNSYWQKKIRAEILGLDDNWDTSWLTFLWNSGSKSIFSLKNLVTNIGYGQSARHSQKFPLIAGVPLGLESTGGAGFHELSEDFGVQVDTFLERTRHGIIWLPLKVVLGVGEKLSRLLHWLLRKTLHSRKYPSLAVALFFNLLRIRFWHTKNQGTSNPANSVPSGSDTPPERQ